MINLSNKLTETLNEFARKEGFFRPSASYIYFRRPGSEDQYFYTPKKINHKGSLRYVSGIYRYLKSKKVLKLLASTVAGNAKKRDAIIRAQKLRDREEARYA